jgi:uncharacterized membrane protein YfcA
MNKLKAAANRLFAYVTGALALAIVAATAVTALIHAAHNAPETLQNLATSALSGVGMAVGGCLGSALVLRFKAARRFVKGVVREISEKQP